MHRDHPEPPLSVPGATSADRDDASTSRQKACMARRQLQHKYDAAVEFKTPINSAIAEGVQEYVMTLYLGTPVQKFFLIADTGSDLVWVQCQPCTTCFYQTHPFFDPSASSSYSPVLCASSKRNQTQLGGSAFGNSLICICTAWKWNCRTIVN